MTVRRPRNEGLMSAVNQWRPTAFFTFANRRRTIGLRQTLHLFRRRTGWRQTRHSSTH